jgi:hypothetical protein
MVYFHALQNKIYLVGNDQSKLTQDNAWTQVNADSTEIDLPGAMISLS